MEPFLALCRETWGEERLWDAVKDLPHGAVKLKKPDGTPLWELNEKGVEVRKDGKRVRAIDPYGKKRTRLMYAAQAGNVARLRWLIARGARLELKDWEGRTALFWASWEGRVEVVRELLARGAVVNAAKNNGATPLYIASEKGHVECVRALLGDGAAINQARVSCASSMARHCGGYSRGDPWEPCRMHVQLGGGVVALRVVEGLGKKWSSPCFT